MSQAPLGFTELFPETIFEAVERLGGRCTGRFLQLNAMENRVYDVSMEDEPNRVVKFYRPGRWDADTIRAEHRFLLSCGEAEIPVVAPLKADGESMFEKNGIFYAVYPKRAGRLEPELNPEQLERLGRYLARLHLVGEKHPSEKRPRLTPTTYARQPLDFLEKERILSPGLGPIYSQYVRELCDLLDPMFATVPYQLLHGDFHIGNLLWNGDEPFIIDFDDMVYGPVVQDLWMVIGGNDEWGRRNLETMLESYETVRSFDRRQLKLIEPLRSLRLVCFAGWIASRREDGAFKHAFPEFGTERYWQEQVESIGAQLEKVRELAAAW